MQNISHLTGMQQHVLDHLGEVVLHRKLEEFRYDLRGREVNAQVKTLIAKQLVVQDRQGQLSLR